MFCLCSRWLCRCWFLWHKRKLRVRNYLRFWLSHLGRWRSCDYQLAVLMYRWPFWSVKSGLQLRNSQLGAERRGNLRSGLIFNKNAILVYRKLLLRKGIRSWASHLVKFIKSAQTWIRQLGLVLPLTISKFSDRVVCWSNHAYNSQPLPVIGQTTRFS